MNKKHSVYMLCNYPQDYRKLGGQTFVFQFLSSPFFLLRPTKNIFCLGATLVIWCNRKQYCLSISWKKRLKSVYATDANRLCKLNSVNGIWSNLTPCYTKPCLFHAFCRRFATPKRFWCSFQPCQWNRSWARKSGRNPFSEKKASVNPFGRQ